PTPALFLCALLNSTTVRTYVDALTEKLQVGALLNRVKLPLFDPNNEQHQVLVSLANSAQLGAEVQGSIDEVVGRILR
ncbi:MAG: hypothetical protein CSA75_01905, partial [Sorangium cellulosum]